MEKEYKSFTTTKILEAIDTEPEMRKEWMMQRFENFGLKMGLMKNTMYGKTVVIHFILISKKGFTARAF